MQTESCEQAEFVDIRLNVGNIAIECVFFTQRHLPDINIGGDSRWRSGQKEGGWRA